jgi:hypothetical protein
MSMKMGEHEFELRLYLLMIKITLDNNINFSQKNLTAIDQSMEPLLYS